MCNDKDYIYTASQDCSKESIGAFTGEVSASMIQSLGVKYVIIGHSERRDIFLESNNDIKLKVSNALENYVIHIDPEFLRKFDKLIAKRFPPPQGPSLMFVPILTFI